MKKFFFLFLFQLIFLPSTFAASFPDVQDPELQEAVKLLYEEDMIQGYEDGTFKPERVINRAEALKLILIKHSDEPYFEGLFTDVQQEDWFAPYVAAAFKGELIKGYDDQSYRPHQEVNRAEFLKIAMKAQGLYFPPPLSQHVAALQQFEDIYKPQWYMPFVSYAHHEGYLDKTNLFRPTDGMTRAEAAILLARVLKDREQKQKEWQALWHQDGKCDSCIGAYDYSEFEWLQRPFVTFEGHRLFIDGRERTEDALCGEKCFRRIKDDLEYFGEDYLLLNVPREEKLALDLHYPDFYDRGKGIHGGNIMWNGKYGGHLSGKYIKNRDGLEVTAGCACDFERYVIWNYNHMPEVYNVNGRHFDEWILTDDGTIAIYDALYIYLRDTTFIRG